MTRSGWGVISKLTDAELEALVSASKSVSECLRKLDLPTSGDSFRSINRRIRAKNLSTSHFVRYATEVLNKPLTLTRFMECLVEDSPISQKTLRTYIRQFALLPYLCAECGQKAFWNGAPLVLQLDHRNGVKTDCRLVNLRWLCPNCHTQTNTFGRRNGAAGVIVSILACEASGTGALPVQHPKAGVVQ